MSTLFRNTEQRVHILADGCPLGLYKQLHTVPIYLGGCTPLLYIRGYTPLLFICTPAHQPSQLSTRPPLYNAIKTKKGDRKNEFCKVF